MIRAATPDDANAIAEVLIASRSAFLPYASIRYTAEEVAAWAKERLIPSSIVTVAVEDELIVAVLATSEKEHCAWIEQLYVRPGFEACGVGSKLLENAHSRLKKPIRLFTFQQNAGARRFYERHGYKAVKFTDGRENEEQCPDVLYELAISAVA